MTRKLLTSLVIIWTLLAVQALAFAGELALETVGPKKHSAAQRYLSRSGTRLEKVNGETFSLPQVTAFMAKIRLGRETPTDVTLLFTHSSENKDQMPDEMRVGIGEKTDFSTIQSLPAEAPAPALGRRQPQTRFTNVKFSFSHGDLQYPLTMDITLHGDGKSPQYAMYQLTSVRTGKLELEGQMVKVLLVDANGNGLFDDKGGPGRGDVLLVDVNGNGKLDRIRGRAYPYFGGEVLPLTPLLHIDSCYYNCEVPPSGSTLKLNAVEPEMGSIAVGGEGLQVQLIGPVYVNTSGAGPKSLGVPIGKYSLVQVKETRKDKSGKDFSIEAMAGGVATGAIEVKAGETVSVEPSKLVKVVGTIHQQGQNRQIGVEFLTETGLRITNATAGRGRPKPPKYEILDSSGALVASGKLEYG